jgi:type IV secretory pathway VirB10-like protein
VKISGLLQPSPLGNDPIPQAGPRLDPPQAPRPGRRRPLDLAHHRLLRPASARPPPRRRPSPALAAALPARPPDPRARPRRIPEHPPGPARTGQRTETRQTRPRPPARLEEPPPGHPPRRRQDRQANRKPRNRPQTARLNNKLRCLLSRRAGVRIPPGALYCRFTCGNAAGLWFLWPVAAAYRLGRYWLRVSGSQLRKHGRGLSRHASYSAQTADKQQITGDRIPDGTHLVVFVPATGDVPDRLLQVTA